MPFDHFSLIAGIYDRTAPFELKDMVLGNLALPMQGRLLDAAGGTGRVAVALRGMVSQVVVADSSRGMLRRASTKGLLSVHSVCESLPFVDNSFERVVVVDAFHHVQDQKKAAQELWRVLNPGGRVVILEPDIRHFRVKMIAVSERLLLMRSHFFHPDRIAAFFSFRDASVSVIGDVFSVWVIAQKVRRM